MARIALGASPPLLAAVLLLLAFGVTASAAPRGAATASVTIQNFAFAPASVTIERGDSVTWTNLDSTSHSAVTVSAGFIGAVLAQNQSTTIAFDRAGTYDYICGVHGPSMRGTIVVRGPIIATPIPTPGVPGHVVDDTFKEARPDEFEAASGSTPFLFASGALALLVIVRLIWVVRHW